jgi:transposase-like protein
MVISFKGFRFPKAIILLAVRWYVAYPLSYRHIEEMLKERGICVDHSTINRWVVKYSPQLEKQFSKKPTGHSWRADETYIKVKGQWVYLYRAVDKEGNTLDFLLREKRDQKAAEAFFQKTIDRHGLPKTVNIDKSGFNLAALEAVNKELPKEEKFKIRQVKYLNNQIEQDHRAIKRLTRPMMGFKSFASAAATLAGIELHHMIKKGQSVLSKMLPPWQIFYQLAN